MQSEIKGKRGQRKPLCILANTVIEMKFLILTLYLICIIGLLVSTVILFLLLTVLLLLQSLETWLICLKIDWLLRCPQLPRISAERWNIQYNLQAICILLGSGISAGIPEGILKWHWVALDACSCVGSWPESFSP